MWKEINLNLHAFSCSPVATERVHSEWSPVSKRFQLACSTNPSEASSSELFCSKRCSIWFITSITKRSTIRSLGVALCSHRRWSNVSGTTPQQVAHGMWWGKTCVSSKNECQICLFSVVVTLWLGRPPQQQWNHLDDESASNYLMTCGGGHTTSSWLLSAASLGDVSERFAPVNDGDCYGVWFD